MVGIEELFVRIVGENPVIQGLVGGLVIAFLNMVGASIVLVWRDPSERFLDASLGFAAGVMLSASFTSLLLPGIEFASAATYHGIGIGGFALRGIVPVLIGFAIGVLVLDYGEKWVSYIGPLISNRLVSEPHETDGGVEDSRVRSFSENSRMMSVLLFTAAITLHNMPEGLAVGVGFGSGNLSNAIGLMIAIGLQNIPEGLAVSIAAINAGLGRSSYAAFAGIRAGLVEIPLAVFGAWAVIVAAPLLPYVMGFAAGGMLYVIADEIIPQTHSRGYERVATLGMMFGIVLMLSLDVMLG
jgi:zinc transporter ZupT